MAEEKKQDMRNGMWERGPVEGWNGKGASENPEQIADVERYNPGIVRPDSSIQAPGQTTSN